MSKYDTIPHVEFEGYRIYMPENKMRKLMSEKSWTVSRIQRQFKIGYYSALHLIRFAQSIEVLDSGNVEHGVTKYKTLIIDNL